MTWSHSVQALNLGSTCGSPEHPSDLNTNILRSCNLQAADNPSCIWHVAARNTHLFHGISIQETSKTAYLGIRDTFSDHECHPPKFLIASDTCIFEMQHAANYLRCIVDIRSNFRKAGLDFRGIRYFPNLDPVAGYFPACSSHQSPLHHSSKSQSQSCVWSQIQAQSYVFNNPASDPRFKLSRKCSTAQQLGPPVNHILHPTSSQLRDPSPTKPLSPLEFGSLSRAWPPITSTINNIHDLRQATIGRWALTSTSLNTNGNQNTKTPWLSHPHGHYPTSDMDRSTPHILQGLDCLCLVMAFGIPTRQSKLKPNLARRTSITSHN